MSEIAVKFENVSMYYNLSREKIDNLKEYMIKLVKRQLFFDEFRALSDISFDVNKGEVFGLVGLNGSGKSTLLKIVAGVLKPTTGRVTVNGTVAPLIELGAGFDPDLSARENVYMNGAVLGYSAAYMSRLYKEIFDFAELWEFEDVPVKNFSSGMYARLGFSIATTVSPDILIVDEILGVGDFKFQQKSSERIRRLIHSGATVLIVSHTPKSIREFCGRVAWLEKGTLVALGDTGEIMDRYEKS